MLAIILTVYFEPIELVKKQVDKIHELYPTSDVILFYDGVIEMPIKNVTHVVSPCHLKTSASAGLWANEWMRAYLSHSKKPYMLKIDPDTTLIKPLSYYPVGDVVFGSTRTIKIGRDVIFRIHGGGCGYSRSLVNRMVAEKMWESPEFINNVRFLDQEDVMLAYLIQRYSIHCVDHGEFSCGRKITTNTSVAHK